MSNLYEKLGAKDGISAIVDDIVEAHMRNPQIRPRFLPYREQPERLETLKGHLRTMMVEATGGPDTYQGRSMPEAHRGMNLGEAEYVAALDDILSVLQTHGVDEDARNDVLAMLYGLKNEIMHV